MFPPPNTDMNIIGHSSSSVDTFAALATPRVALTPATTAIRLGRSPLVWASEGVDGGDRRTVLRGKTSQLGARVALALRQRWWFPNHQRASVAVSSAGTVAVAAAAAVAEGNVSAIYALA